MSASLLNEHDANPAIDVFPAFFKVSGKRVIVVGGGDEAAAKLRLLSETSAELEVYASSISPAMEQAIQLSGATLFARDYQFEDFADAALVFTAQESEAEDTLVVEAARMVGVPAGFANRSSVDSIQISPRGAINAFTKC